MPEVAKKKPSNWFSRALQPVDTIKEQVATGSAKENQVILMQTYFVNPRRHMPFCVLRRHKEGGGLAFGP